MPKCQVTNTGSTEGELRRCYTPFTSEFLGNMQIAFPKGRGVSGKFYKNVVLKKKMRIKLRKSRPKPGLQHVRLLHDKAQ